MNLTRSIRRKLAVALGLLLLAQAGLFGASLVGLWDYRALVRDLEVATNEAPRRTQLLASIGQLADPLAIAMLAESKPLAARVSQARFQRLQLEKAIANVTADVDRYFERLAEFHEFPRFSIPDNLERDIDRQRTRLLQTLDDMRSAAPALEQWTKRDESLVFIAKNLAGLNETAKFTPDPFDKVQPMLLDARESYRLHFWFVSVAGVVATLLIFAIVGVAVRWVYQPIRRLHRLATCVAAGDFEKRAQVCSSNDELAQLARTLNEMIDRFQLNMEDRDREIAQRSQQLIQSARLADTGFLAAGIAHEVNNPLAGVGYAAESLQERVRELLEVDEETGHIPDPDPRDVKVVNNYLEMIARETSRIRELTEKMKDFGRRDPAEEESERYRYDITAIVAEVISLIGHMKRYEDREIVFAPEKPIYALVTASQIKQVILNLIANALDAVGSGGRLKIIAKECPDTVRLTFVDNGSGMDAETLDHIFDPFYTTKLGQDGSEKGTGLGLAICHRIVTDHDGTLEAESAGEGTGSTFRLKLPKAIAATKSHAA